MNSIQINPDYLRGLLHIAADKDIRYYLNAVLVEVRARETRYVATNGHMLAVLRDELPENEPDQIPAQIIIPRETCKLAASSARSCHCAEMTRRNRPSCRNGSPAGRI